jgi:TPP-dependent pyruvate/acetoin dehydrogenase alpha subunit
MIIDETSVLPTAASAGQFGGAVEVVDRDGEVVVGFISPASGHDAVAVGVGVVAGEDVVLVAARDEDAIADGDDGSMRIFSSQSSVMNRHVGSTSGFTTVRSRP